MDSETNFPQTEQGSTGRYTALDKMTATKGRQTSTLSSESGWTPISSAREAQVLSLPTETWYVTPDGQKKRAVGATIPHFPQFNERTTTENLNTPKSVSLLIENPILLSEKNWLEQIDQIPNFEGNKIKAARFMYDLSYGILDVRNKQAKKGEQYQIPSIVIYYGENRTQFGTHYEASTNQIVISSHHLANYSRYNGTGRIVFRTDIKGNDIVFDGMIGNHAKLIGVEEATHSAKNQRKAIEAVVSDRRAVQSLAEYDATDEEYEALQEQLDFAQRERMDKETIQVITLRLRRAEDVRRSKGLR